MANQYTKQNNKPGRVKYPGHKLKHMKKITFDFTPYVLDSYDIEVTRYNENDAVVSFTKCVAHKINGAILFENFEPGSHEFMDAEKKYIITILLNS